MSVETPQKTKVVLKRANKTVQVSMSCNINNATTTFFNYIRRKGGSLFYGHQEIKGNLYDLIKASVERHIRGRSDYSLEAKLLNFEKPEGDILDTVKDVFCNGKESSLRVEYEFHSLDENLFDCKDCG